MSSPESSCYNNQCTQIRASTINKNIRGDAPNSTQSKSLYITPQKRSLGQAVKNEQTHVREGNTCCRHAITNILAQNHRTHTVFIQHTDIQLHPNHSLTHTHHKHTGKSTNHTTQLYKTLYHPRPNYSTGNILVNSW